jgi:hypothetical protein
MVDVSIDIETLGKHPGAVVLSIGACAFDPNDGVIVDRFYVNIDLWSSLDHGLCIDETTRRLWATDPEFLKARHFLMNDRRPLPEALDSFTEWYRGAYEVKQLWAKPPQFDVGLTEAAYYACNKGNLPWHFRAPRCLRTLIDISEFDQKTVEFVGVKHYALDDAIHQAKVVAAAKAKLSRPVSA